MALRFSTVGIAMPLFLFIVPHVLPHPPRRRRGRFIVPAPTNTPKMALRISTVDIAILLFYLLYPTFCHVHSVGVGADLSCPYPRTPPKWHCVFPPLILQYIIPHPRTPTKWRCNSYHFATSKPFGSDCKTGTINRPLRLTECSLPYICAINGYCGMFVAIHLRYPFRYFYLLYPTFRHVHPVGVGADLSCPYPRTPPKWHCVFPPLILQYIIPHPRTPTKWRCNSYHFATSKPFGSDCKTGTINRPLRLTECSLPYICAINGYCGMFVAIHLRYPFRYFYLLYPTFRHVHPVGVGADLSCPCPRISTKWCCIFALLALQFISFRHIKTIWFGL